MFLSKVELTVVLDTEKVFNQGDSQIRMTDFSVSLI